MDKKQEDFTQAHQERKKAKDGEGRPPGADFFDKIGPEHEGDPFRRINEPFDRRVAVDFADIDDDQIEAPDHQQGHENDDQRHENGRPAFDRRHDLLKSPLFFRIGLLAGPPRAFVDPQEKGKNKEQDISEDRTEVQHRQTQKEEERPSDRRPGNAGQGSGIHMGAVHRQQLILFHDKRDGGLQGGKIEGGGQLHRDQKDHHPSHGIGGKGDEHEQDADDPEKARTEEDRFFPVSVDHPPCQGTRHDARQNAGGKDKGFYEVRRHPFLHEFQISDDADPKPDPGDKLAGDDDPDIPVSPHGFPVPHIYFGTRNCK